MPAASDFRRVADLLGQQAVEEVGRMDSGEAADFLRDMAHAGKAALEAARAAELGAGEITRMLEGMADELEAAGLAELEATLSVEDFLRHVLTAVRQAGTRLERQGPREEALAGAYRVVARRLLTITRQAEATGQEGSLRVARANRTAIEESVIRLEQAGLSIPIEAP